MTAVAPLAFEQIYTTPLALVDESPTNTRRTWGNLDELAASFKEVGILQPLVGRSKGDRFELIFGHRRFRAAKLAQLEAVPLIVRNLNDAQALEAQTIENLQRIDLHPLEEAEAFEQLHALGWSADEMGAKIGRSRAYVFGRMKLLELAPDAREAFYAGRLTASVAQLLARVPASLQPQALKEIEEEALEYDDEAYAATSRPKKGDATPMADPLSARAASRLLRNKYMLELAHAPFDRGDAELVPAAGACKDCPKRSGNQRELFADVASLDVCTDPVCFGQKKAAAAQGLIDKLTRKGVTLVEAKESKSYGGVQPPAGYVRLDERCYEGSVHGKTYGKTYGEIANGKRVAQKLEGRERVVMLDEKNKPVELLKKSVLAAAGVDTSKPSRTPGYQPPSPEEEARRTMKADAEVLADRTAIEALVARVEADGLPDALVRILIDHNWELREIAARRGWKVRTGHNASYDQDLAKLKGNALLGMLVELAMERGGDRLEAACAWMKFDHKAVTAKALAELKEKAKETPAPGAAAKKTAKKKGKKAKR
jgi:ParB family transcriptional regulator, chromosome partitioning protein